MRGSVSRRKESYNLIILYCGNLQLTVTREAHMIIIYMIATIISYFCDNYEYVHFKYVVTYTPAHTDLLQCCFDYLKYY